MHPRREQKPESQPTKTKTELPLNDPNYHYRIVSKEKDTSDRVAYHKELGYGIAHDSGRALTMAVHKDEHEKRRREAIERARRIREQRVENQGDLALDETTIERTATSDE